MIFIVNGPQRSGSTLIYQLCRDMLAETKNFCNFDPNTSFDDMEITEIHNYLGKQHDYFPEKPKDLTHIKNIKLIGTIRNLYDTLNSHRHMFFRVFENSSSLKDLENTIRVIVQNYKTYHKKIMAFYHRHPMNCLILFYEDFYNDNLRTCERLQKFLGINLDYGTLGRIANTCNLENIKLLTGETPEPETLAYVQFRQGHIGPANGVPFEGYKHLSPVLKKTLTKIIDEELK